MIPVALTIYITDEPLGVTGYDCVAVSPWDAYIGLGILVLISLYVWLRPTLTLPPWRWHP